MKSIRQVYKIGRGPSSSHTMGPEKAASLVLLECPDADSYKVVLYGSLAKTGRGHKTDAAYAISTLAYPTGLRCGMMSLSDCAQIHLVEENGYVSRHLSGSVSQQYSDVFPQYSKILQRCHI